MVGGTLTNGGCACGAVMSDGTVYLLHFERPISPNSPSQHYCGFTKHGLQERLADHLAGRGSRFTQVAIERGVKFEVVRTWTGGRSFERKLKNRKCLKMYCPVCNPGVRSFHLE